jgi:glycerol-3-phosphate dehydrogenase (NAD(P)+)
MDPQMIDPDATPHALSPPDFGIVGAGAWGTALAQTLARAGNSVLLWGRDAALVRILSSRRENTRYLPGIPLLDGITFTTRLSKIADAKHAILLVTPAQGLRSACLHLSPFLDPYRGVPLVVATKGLDSGSDQPLSALVRDLIPAHPVAVLSGPNFAKEVAVGLPAATVIAAQKVALAERLADLIGSASFRPYASSDPLGVEMCGAFKNVLAIACGIAQGRHLGDNARAGLITRGMAELMRLGKAMNFHTETLVGLSGLGDIVLTCNGLQSRNYTLGIALGEGMKLPDILAQRRSVTEGVHTAAALHRISLKAGVNMPIVAAVDSVLTGHAGVEDVIAQLLARPLRREV